MTLPGEAEPDFVLIRPFIPGGQSQRQNMTAWVAGRTGPDGISSLVVYRFPRQETVFGPTQVEARINQDPEISAQISLWNQSGSRVIRGNLLVIPIGESMLYVQPLYLQAAQTVGALPELKRVIVASSENVVMAETLVAALAELTGAPGSTTSAEQEADQGAILSSPTPKSRRSWPRQSMRLPGVRQRSRRGTGRDTAPRKTSWLPCSPSFRQLTEAGNAIPAESGRRSRLRWRPIDDSIAFENRPADANQCRAFFDGDLRNRWTCPLIGRRARHRGTFLQSISELPQLAEHRPYLFRVCHQWSDCHETSHVEMWQAGDELDQ